MIVYRQDFKQNFWILIVFLITLIGGTMGYYIAEYDQTLDLTIGDYIFITSVLAVCAVTLLYVLPMKRDYDKGLPVADERSLKAAYKSGFYTWVITIYIAVTILIFQDLIVRVFDLKELAVEHVTGIIVFSSIIIFILLSNFFDRRAETD